MELALQCVLEKHRLLMPGDEEATRRAELALLLSWLKVNVVVDHHATKGAPVVVEDNPVFNNLFGSIALAADGGGQEIDFLNLRAGSLLRAHGGFLMLHLQDLLADAPVWERLRRLLRSGRLQLEQPGFSSNAGVQPHARFGDGCR
jgi:predicted ATP-dependent protease